MNLRLSAKEIRFRVSSIEVDKLLETSILSEVISLGTSHTLTMTICLSEAFGFNSTNTEFKLNILRSEVENASQGKNKSEMSSIGIWSTEVSELYVIFEIDAFSKKRMKIDES